MTLLLQTRGDPCCTSFLLAKALAKLWNMDKVSAIQMVAMLKMCTNAATQLSTSLSESSNGPQQSKRLSVHGTFFPRMGGLVSGVDLRLEVA